jgi:hypothetical protein
VLAADGRLFARYWQCWLQMGGFLPGISSVACRLEAICQVVAVLAADGRVFARY